MTGSVTVSITRHVPPDHEDQMLAWLRAGAGLAERFDGFLGSGWVRPAPDSTEWHMLYRFADAERLEAWMTSQQRRWWLDSAQGFVDESRLERRTGIEGWFDEPSPGAGSGERAENVHSDVEDLRPAPPAPPRWKQMVAIFIVFWPLSLVMNIVGVWALPDVWLPVRVTLTVGIMTPLMTYVLLPWITRLLAPWLNRPSG